MEKAPGTHLTGFVMDSSPGVNAWKKTSKFLALSEIEA
jgi:hypothetical protein